VPPESCQPIRAVMKSARDLSLCKEQKQEEEWEWEEEIRKEEEEEEASQNNIINFIIIVNFD